MSDTAEEIKHRLDIADFLRGYIDLAPAGKNFKARCPFHKEKSPSFMVNRDRQIWHCFGCGEGGDIFKFLMKFENIEFFEALKILAEKAGVEVKAGAGDAFRETYELNRMAKDFFVSQMHGTQSAYQASALKYILGRGLAPETIKEFEIGLAPTTSDSLFRHLVSQKKPVAEMEKAGLVMRTERGTLWDRFRGRLMFPLYNHFGKVVGFTGRVLPQEIPTGLEAAKYVNSPETPVFQKSKLLYGFHRAKNFIREAKTAVIVEGQMDFLMMWQDGVKNTVASSGTALTSEHLAALRKIADNLVLSFDADDAGQMAAERSIDLANSFDFNVRILRVKEGKDPADVVVQSPGLMAKYIADAVPAMEFYFERYVKNGDLPADRKKNIRIVLGKLKTLSSHIDRAHWLRELSGKTSIPESALMEEMDALKAERKLTPDTFKSPTPVEAKVSRKELVGEALLCLVCRTPALKTKAEECAAYLDPKHAELIRCVSEGGTFTAAPEHLQPVADLVSLRASLGEQKKELPDAQKELNNLMRELKSLSLRERQQGLRNKIGTLERSGADAELAAALKEFDQISKEIHNI